MLLKREDLRNRLIRLVSRGQITVMTKALHDAGRRMSRFLLMQLLLTARSAGGGRRPVGTPRRVCLPVGLLGGRVPLHSLYGHRFAAVPPIILSLAMFPGWIQPMLLIGLFLAIELTASNVIEPWLYGKSIGVSVVALPVAAALWAFLLGPSGWSCPVR